MLAEKRRAVVLLVALPALLATGGAALFHGNSIQEWWWLARMDSGDTDTRRAAAGRLGRLRSSRAVPRLMDLLREGYGGAAWNALVEVGAPAVPALEEEASRGKPITRQEAVNALARIAGTEQAGLTALGRLLSAGDWEARYRVMKVLGSPGLSLGPRAAPLGPFLTAALRDADLEVACGAAEALARLGDDARGEVPRMIQALEEEERRPRVRHAIASALLHLRPDLEATVRSFHDRNTCGSCCDPRRR